MKLVYYTSKTGNTKRFLDGIDLPYETFRIDKQDKIIDDDFILFCPTYADRAGRHKVPPLVVKFLNHIENRSRLLGVVGFGNRNFGKLFAISADVISQKCNVPILYKVELFGNLDERARVKDIVNGIVRK